MIMQCHGVLCLQIYLHFLTCQIWICRTKFLQLFTLAKYMGGLNLSLSLPFLILLSSWMGTLNPLILIFRWLKILRLLNKNFYKQLYRDNQICNFLCWVEFNKICFTFVNEIICLWNITHLFQYHSRLFPSGTE